MGNSPSQSAKGAALGPVCRWILADQLFDGGRLHNQWALGLDAQQRVCQSLPRAQLPVQAAVDYLEGCISPGFVDLQVNGGGGVLFNASPTPEAMARIAAAHHALGTVALLPTLITDAAEVLEQAVDAMLAAKDLPGVAGLHIEGPHIARARRGTHDAAFIRPLDTATLRQVERLRAAQIPVMITLAPEAAQPADIAVLAAMGAVVSLGHSDADAAQVEAALAAGACCFTHLYNAMSPMQGRAPGMVGSAINSTAWAGFICDGQHVSDSMLGLAIRARPVPERMFLVSDAMPTVGGPEQFTLYGQRIQLQQGRLLNADGALAGAHVTMAEGVTRLIHHLGIAPEQALRMALSVPCALMQLPLACVTGRSVRELIVLDCQWRLRALLSDCLS